MKRGPIQANDVKRFLETRAELLAMPSVQHVNAAAAALAAHLYELGGLRRLESLTLTEVHHMAHVALFTKDPGPRFAIPEVKA